MYNEIHDEDVSQVLQVRQKTGDC